MGVQIPFIIQCPNCNDTVIIEKIKCGIFRHGVIKKTGKQMNPHCKKEKCEKLKQEGAIYGCGKPFQIIKTDGVIRVVICDYI
jgi:hypothetical protein